MHRSPEERTLTLSSLDAKPAAKGPLVVMSPGFGDWLTSVQSGLALTTYQAGRLILIGRKPDGGVRLHERLLEHCQGLWSDGRSLWASTVHSLFRFENDLLPGERLENGVDTRFAPRETRITGAVDIHDIGMARIDGVLKPLFVATGFNCLATISDSHSFREVWRPPFVSRLVGEDRCHLNGLAMDGERPAFVSAIGRSDIADGWRDHRRSGGIIIDVASREIVARDLSMPHSPRLYRDRLWVLDSGRGELLTIDPASGERASVAFCPGYARGLAFIGDYAVIGLSRPRNNLTFDGLELDERLEDKGAIPRCGLVVVDIRNGQTVAWLRFEHTLQELYDVAVLPGVTQAEAIGFVGDDIKTVVRPQAAL